MSEKSKIYRITTAYTLALTLILPSVGMANVVQPRPIPAIVAAAQAAVPLAPEVTQVDDRSDRRGRINRDQRRGDRGDRQRRARHQAEQEAQRRADRQELQRRANLQALQRQRLQERQRAERDRRAHNNRDGQKYRNGYRGSRDRRQGYRQDNDGWWFPLAAFALGAIIVNESNKNQPARAQQNNGWSHIPARNMSAHDNWCDQQYRSYSRANKTFQPYNGPRRYCNSPFDRI